MAEKNESIDVPPDFPRAKRLAAVGGAAPKLLLVRAPDGKFTEPMVCDEEVLQRWQVCEDLAVQFAHAAVRSKNGKRSDWNEEDILAQYLPRLKAKGWTSDEESVWVLQRSAVILNWPVPDALVAK